MWWWVEAASSSSSSSSSSGSGSGSGSGSSRRTLLGKLSPCPAAGGEDRKSSASQRCRRFGWQNAQCTWRVRSSPLEAI